MTEQEFRSALAAEARTWIGTPYHANGTLKAVGVNCAEFVYWAGRNSGALPADAPLPRWYTPQLATNSKEERLIGYLKSYGGVEISEAQVAAGDVVAYKTGKSHGHVAIVLDYPVIIHVLPVHGCQMGLVNEGKLGAYSRRYFTFWKEPQMSAHQKPVVKPVDDPAEPTDPAPPDNGTGGGKSGSFIAEKPVAPVAEPATEPKQL
jgi:cell wall-associated NlpC family hydrolase